MKAKFSAHEVITTIMLNFIALALASYIINNLLFVPATVHTPEISSNAWLPRFDSLLGIFNSSPFNLSIIAAIICIFAAGYFINKTSAGYELTTFGFNKNAANYAHINSSKIIITTMTLSGGIAGLAGSSFVMGYKHYFELGFSDGAGFIGIAAALIGKNKPSGIIAASVFFGILEYGGLTINSIVPKEIVTILQGLIILSIIIFSNFPVFRQWSKKPIQTME
jgi:simple sugar transport system permease protein